ncbi:MAG TPA: hypothetical protein VMI52_02195 [Acetobacteraceae bacterium]|nr:hypothetical protein [Acetobacteraceae bacterium]
MMTPREIPQTAALRRALGGVHDRALAADLLFLEAWEMAPQPDVGIALKVGQIRRANPALAAEIRAELENAKHRRTQLTTTK